mgnify:CR=1 FL=1
MRITECTCNYLGNPLGVESPRPLLGWKIESERKGVLQSSYEIEAASSVKALKDGAADVWKSGKVYSRDTTFVEYGGRMLASRERVWWRVRAWDRKDKVSDWSQPQYWEMGLLTDADWSARWIGARGFTDPQWGWCTAGHLRREFTVAARITQARLYVCGVGYHDVWLNGARVTDEVLTPAVSDYTRRAYYQSFDVTELLQEGSNAIGVVLGDGWYNHKPQDVWNFFAAPWRGLPRLTAQLEIHHDDGTETRVVSDGSWSVSSDGPILTNGLRCGEVYDARKEFAGWASAGFAQTGWTPAVLVPGPGGRLHSQQMTPMRVVRERKPAAWKEVKPGVWVVDFGENITGWGHLRVNAPEGTEITLAYGEKLTPDGDVDQSNINSLVKGCDVQTDKYFCAGRGLEEWNARFTYHGFQYVRVTGLPAAPTSETLTALVLHTDFETRGEFSCSNDLLNRIQRITQRSTLGNFHGFPTDCPHREKNGWTGDAQLSAEQCLFNFNPMSAYAKWMQDFRDAQRQNGALPAIVPAGSWGFTWGNGLAWDSAAFIIPWTQYLYCGDAKILADQYPCMRAYLDHVATLANDDGTVDYGLGDWCPPTGGPAGGKCPPIITSTAYYYIDAQIAARTAALLGHHAEAATYERLMEKIRAAFRARFLDPATKKMQSDSQTAYACALYQGMVDPDEAAAVMAHLATQIEAHGRHLDTGILGTKYLLHALTACGRTDLAYAITTQESFPSWGHWLAQGATTLWEDWAGASSRNHHMFGDVSAWFYRALAGINPDPEEPGFRHIIIRPNPVNGLDSVKAWHESMYGRIGVSWRREGKQFFLTAEIPPNTTATVWLPATSVKAVTINDGPLGSADGVLEHGTEAKTVWCRLGSGRYELAC